MKSICNTVFMVIDNKLVIDCTNFTLRLAYKVVNTYRY